MVVGQAMRQRRTSYARGGQVTSRLSRDEQGPTTAENANTHVVCN
jgi:hypothetical protein